MSISDSHPVSRLLDAAAEAQAEFKRLAEGSSLPVVRSYAREGAANIQTLQRQLDALAGIVKLIQNAYEDSGLDTL